MLIAEISVIINIDLPKFRFAFETQNGTKPEQIYEKSSESETKTKNKMGYQPTLFCIEELC